jgi:tetratricopeptide (TPR) repeat protein
MAENQSTYREDTMELVARGILTGDEQITFRQSHPWPALILPAVFVVLSLIGIGCLIWLIYMQVTSPTEEPVTLPLILTFVLMLLPLFLGYSCVQSILTFKSIWIVLTSHDRIVGSMTRGFWLKRTRQFAVPLAELRGVEWKTWQGTANTARMNAGLVESLILFVLEIVMAVAIGTSGKLVMQTADGEKITFHGYDLDKFYEQVQAARARLGLGPSDWKEQDQEEARSSFFRTAIIVMVGMVVFFLVAMFFLGRAKNAGQPTKQTAGEASTPRKTTGQKAGTPSAEEYIKRANETKDTNEKLAFAEKAIELSPVLWSAYNLRGNIFFERREYQRALDDYSKAVELNPSDAVVWNNRGNTYMRMKQSDKALEDFNNAIAVNPKYAPSYFYIGSYHLDRQEYETAIDFFTKAIGFDDRYAWAYKARGQCYLNRNEYDSAIRDLDKALEISPTYTSAYAIRGTAFLRKGETDRSISDYDKAIEIDPGYGYAYAQRGVAFFRKAEWEKCIQDNTRAIELNWIEPITYRNRGTAFMKLGKSEAAQEDMRKAEELEKQNRQGK